MSQLLNDVRSGVAGVYANSCNPVESNNEVGEACNNIRDQFSMLKDSIMQLRTRITPICEQPSPKESGPQPTLARRSELGSILYGHAEELGYLNQQVQMILQSIVL